MKSLLSKKQVLDTIAGLVQVEDAELVSELASGSSRVVSENQAALAVRLGQLLSKLLSDYDYTESDEFTNFVAKKPRATVAMYLKQEMRADRQRLRQGEFRRALVNIVDGNRAFLLTSEKAKPLLDQLRACAIELDNPD